MSWPNDPPIRTVDKDARIKELMDEVEQLKKEYAIRTELLGKVMDDKGEKNIIEYFEAKDTIKEWKEKAKLWDMAIKQAFLELDSTRIIEFLNKVNEYNTITAVKTAKK